MQLITNIVKLHIEGMGVRGMSRFFKVEPSRIRAITLAVGLACACLHDRIMRNVRVDHVQVDELWAFVGEKDKSIKWKKKKKKKWVETVPRGSVWTFFAMSPESNLVISYLIGRRQYCFAHQFIEDLHSRLACRITLISDGYSAYARAIARIFGPSGIDYGIVNKIRDKKGNYVRSDKYRCLGNPDPKIIHTVDVENTNLHHRMKVKRMQRQTNGHSKIILAHFAAVSLWLVWHNFCNVQDVLGKKTPAMVAGLTSEPWPVERLIHEAVGTLLTSGDKSGGRLSLSGSGA